MTTSNDTDAIQTLTISILGFSDIAGTLGRAAASSSAVVRGS